MYSRVHLPRVVGRHIPRREEGGIYPGWWEEGGLSSPTVKRERKREALLAQQ